MELFWTDAAGQVRLVEFDATLREEHLGTSTPTRYPVEGGSTAVDHAVLEPVARVFEVFVSDSPAHVPSTHMFGVRGTIETFRVPASTSKLARGATANSGAEIEFEKVETSARVLTFDGPVARRERVLAELEHLRVERQLVSVSTTLDSIEDMLITKVGAPLEARDGDGITFRLELLQISFGEAQVVQAPDPEQPRGRPSTNAGESSTSEADPELESLWHRTSTAAGWL